MSSRRKERVRVNAGGSTGGAAASSSFIREFYMRPARAARVSARYDRVIFRSVIEVVRMPFVRVSPIVCSAVIALLAMALA
ncbi:MAG TPA: hypothetical protein VFJ87_08875, partial [Rhodanobacteraceae bacterium]|nr:hypothetical protein [Rhodanobacteraceae bacterium]